MQVLRHVPAVEDPRVLVGSLTRDDAAVYQVDEDRAIVATVDFFTPIVDDPYTFGAIAAANALSDIYAMGATPRFALHLVAWPREPEILELVGPTVQGSVAKAREAGVFILGGHSIEDREPKFGMVTIGEVQPSNLLTNAGAHVGNRLVLTKPIGTGILATALKQSRISEQDMSEAVRAMTTLNAGATAAARTVGSAVRAVTDVTGFGLIGHLHTMLQASGMAAVLHADAVPLFDRVRELVNEGAVPGGTQRNKTAGDAYVRWASGIDETVRIALCDAQTSGGLLLAVDADAVDRLLVALAERQIAAVVIGEIIAGDHGAVEVRSGTG
jgi:selenide,water dikinase